MTRPNQWPRERHDRLVVLIDAGLTASEIGVQLGLTRNAVLGYARRKGLKLPVTAEKTQRAMAALIGRRKPRMPGEPRAEGRRKPPADHASRRSRPRSARAFTDMEIAVAIAALMAGQSANKAARMIRASAQSLKKNWLKCPDLVEAGRALFEQAKADAAIRAAERREREALEAETRRVTIERTNWPVFGLMSERDRSICERRVAGETLQEIGDAFGLTRERIRQIEARWRVRGLIVPDAKPLSEVCRARFIPREPRPRGRKPKDRSRNPGAPADFWALAATYVPPPPKRRNNLSDAERQRRSDWMRSVAHKRWEHRA